MDGRDVDGQWEVHGHWTLHLQISEKDGMGRGGVVGDCTCRYD